jgi:SAM-dependent methyltransferase
MSAPGGSERLEAAPRRETPGWLARLLRQFERPHGALGHVAGWIMAARGSNRERTLRSIDLLGVRPGDRVLEIGFGPGVSIRALAERAAPGRVVGIDHSATMLRQARRRNAAAVRGGRVELQLAAVEDLPRFAEPFDRILAVNCVMFWREPAARFRELRERLAPRGRIAVTYQPRHPGASDADARRKGAELAALLGQTGFVQIRVETLPLAPVAAVCVLGEAPPPGRGDAR